MGTWVDYALIPCNVSRHQRDFIKNAWVKHGHTGKYVKTIGNSVCDMQTSDELIVIIGVHASNNEDMQMTKHGPY